MRWLLFLARLAFICNLFFIACVIFRYWTVVQNQSIVGFVVIIGWLMAPVINLIFNVSFVLSFYRRKETLHIPRWLIMFNVGMQLLQLIIITVG
jgi:hypothetical protein